MIIAGGRPNMPKEAFMVKDDEGLIITDRVYIRENPHLFDYIGSQKVNSTVFHIYQFIPAR